VIELDETAAVTIDPPPKKFTLRKKQLATKTKKSPAKKGKKSVNGVEKQ